MTDEPVAEANAHDRTGAELEHTPPEYEYENVETVATVMPFTGRE